MHNKKIFDLSSYRLAKSKEDLETAIELIELRRYNQSVNRSYYAIFHATRAILALDEIDFKKHSAVILYFQQNYIKSLKLSKELSNIIVGASLIRNKSDYSDYVSISMEMAKEQSESADIFIKEVESYLEKRRDVSTNQHP